LNEKELKILEKISEVEEDVINSGELYRAVKEEIEMGYTRFYESLNKLDNMRLIHMDFTGRGHRGRTRMIRLRYPKEIVRESLKMMMR
jgi:cell division control protein 6